MKQKDMKQSSMTFAATRGFTLIELMIVVAIIGIISTIAYSSYQDSVRKTKRAEAKATLLELAQKMERGYTANGAYDTANSVHDGTTLSSANTTTPNSHYTIAMPVLTASTFELTATSTFSDPQCTVFSVTNTGSKTAEDDSGAASTVCW